MGGYYHRKVWVPGISEPIDANIAYLIKILNLAGLKTEQSCEDWGTLIRQSGWGPKDDDIPVGWAYIKFATGGECARFCESLTKRVVYGIPQREGEPMFVAFPAADIPRLEQHWRQQVQ